MGLALVGCVVVVVPQKVEQIVGSNAGAGVPIDSLEGRVGCEGANLAESLPGGFEIALAVAHRNQQVLQAVLAFVA